MKLSPIEILMAIAVPLAWGSGLVVAKNAITDFPPILLMAFRFLITASLLVWFVRPPFSQMRQLFVIAIIAAAIQYSLTFTGLKGLEVGFAALLVQLEVPILVILGVLLLGEKPGGRKWVGIAIAFGGVALLIGRVEFGGAWTSVALVLGGAATWGLGQIYVRKLQNIDGLTTTAWVAVFATPQLFLMSFLFEDNHVEAITTAPWDVWAAAFYLGIVMTCFGYFLWYSLIRKHDVGTVAPFLLLLPVFSVLLGALFLGEVITWDKITGGAITILGVAFVSIERRHVNLTEAENLEI
jgi:O-acetylserine/cysteine efflux transporter